MTAVPEDGEALYQLAFGLAREGADTAEAVSQLLRSSPNRAVLESALLALEHELNARDNRPLIGPVRDGTDELAQAFLEAALRELP